MSVIVIIGSLAAFVAGVAQSTLGFGMAMIMAPCIMLVLEPMAVVPTILLVNILNSMIVMVRFRRFIHWRQVLPLSAGGIAGFTLGIQLLAYLDPNYSRLFVGLLVLTFTAILWSGWRRPMRETVWTLVPVGLVSGFVGGSTSMSGPPVILFLANQGAHRDHFRANLICYFTITNVYGILRFLHLGAFTGEIVRYAAVFIPATLLGTAAGMLLGGRIPEAAFRRIVFVVLLLIAAMLIINSLRS